MKTYCKSWVTLLFVSIQLAINAQIPSSGLVGAYLFNGNAQDSSGNDYHAVTNGGMFVSDRFGNTSGAIALNGITDSIVYPLSGFTPLNGDFSVSFWMKTKSPERQNVFSLKQSPEDTTDNFEMQLNGNSSLQTILELYFGSFTYWNGSGWSTNRMQEGSAGLYYNNKWHHFVIRREADTLQLWHDRDLLAESLITGNIGDNLPFVTGAAPHRFSGSLDEVLFYDRALTDTEIMQLHHRNRPFVFKSPAKTDAYQSNDTVYVRWSWDDTVISDSVDLHYRLNAGGTWIATDHNHLPDWDIFYFPLGFPAGTTIELRVRDHHDTTLYAETGAFIISEYAWQQVSPSLPFTPRDGCGLLHFQDKMWLIGGWDPPHHESNNYTCSEVYSSTDGINWQYHGEAPWQGRHCSGWLVHDSAMWVIGGDPQSGALRDVWKSTDGDNWVQVLDTIPDFNPLRTMHMTASLGDYMYNFGGQPIAYVRENVSQVWRSTDGQSWERLPDAPWNPRGMMLNSCVDEQDTLWLLGGGRLYDRACFSDVWKTGDGVNWELVNEAAPWQPRYWHNVAWFDHKMWVIAGSAYQTDNNETWYSENGVEWHELKNSPFGIRHAAATTVYDNALWLMSGINSNNSWKLVNTSATTSVKTISEPRFDLFPNPFSDEIHVSGADASIDRILVYTVAGEQITPVIRFSGMVTIDLSGYEPGIYLVHLIHNGRTIVKRVVKS